MTSPVDRCWSRCLPIPNPPASLIPSNAARDEGDEDASDDGEAPDPPDGAEGSPDARDDASDADVDDQDGDDGDPIRDRKVKALSDEAKRHRLAAKTERERADDLQRQLDAAPGVAAVNEANQRADFYRQAAGHVDDLGAAWKLADHSLITTGDGGNTTGVDAAVKQLRQSYPHLFDNPSDDARGRTTDVPPGPGSGGSPTNPRRGGNPTGGTPRSQLDEKFPALARSRRR